MRTWFFEDGEPILDANGNIKIIEDVESLAENIDQRLKLFKGKYFLDTTAGVPYFEEILKKPVDPGLAASVLNAEILKEPEVLSIGSVSVDLDRNTRIFNYDATIQTIFGELEVSI